MGEGGNEKNCTLYKEIDKIKIRTINLFVLLVFIFIMSQEIASADTKKYSSISLIMLAATSFIFIPILCLIPPIIIITFFFNDNPNGNYLFDTFIPLLSVFVIILALLIADLFYYIKQRLKLSLILSVFLLVLFLIYIAFLARGVIKDNKLIKESEKNAENKI